MKSKTFSLLIILICQFIISCGDDEPVNEPSKPSDIIYPTEVGNYWSYDRLFTMKLDDSLIGIVGIQGIYDTTFTSTAYVEIEDQKFINDTTEAYEFVEYHNMGTVNVSYSYFTNEESGFYMHAYKYVGVATPKKSDFLIEFNGHKFSSPGELIDFISRLMTNNAFVKSNADTLYPPDTAFRIESPPVDNLSYPLSVGSEWIYRETSGVGEIHRKIVSTAPVNTPAGTFTCYKIQLIHLSPDMAGMFEMYDYICGMGLIKRTFTDSITFTDHEGNIIGTGTINVDLSLTDYYVQ